MGTRPEAPLSGEQGGAAFGSRCDYRSRSAEARKLALGLRPATQERYRDTARADTATIVRHKAIVGTVGVVTLAASITSVVASDLSAFLKVLFAALGAGIGSLIILVPVVYVATLAAAPHRQRNAARAARLQAIQDGKTAQQKALDDQAAEHRQEVERLQTEAETARREMGAQFAAQEEEYEGQVEGLVDQVLTANATRDQAVAELKELREAPPRLVKQQLQVGLQLREWVRGTVSSPPPNRDELHENDPVFAWARDTLNLLYAHYPQYANRFYGEGRHNYVPSDFAMHYFWESGPQWVEALDRRVDVLVNLLHDIGEEP